MTAYGDFEAVIGLEVHCQLATETKIFCGCPAKPEAGKSVADLEANHNACPICAGHPGTLPVLNKKAVDYAIRLGLATGCEIRRENVFARKNYFYPDLPKGYQISQYDRPICEHGHLEIETPAGVKRVPIQRIHLEEDAGKNTHHGGYSLVNLNRAGTPLCEIVSAPDLRSPQEAGAYLRALHAVVTYLGVSDGNMQEGNFRCDANVSVRPKGEEKLGTRVEIKNVNSFRFVEKAIEYEIHRQIETVRAGGKIVQETRTYDAAKNATLSMRSKEEAMDYRYFPEPDLAPVRIDEVWIARARESLPELPQKKKARFIDEFGLPADDAAVLTASKAVADFFEAAVSALGFRMKPGAGEAKLAANLITGEVSRLLNEEAVEITRSRLRPEHVADLVCLLNEKVVSSTGAKQALGAAWRSGESIADIVKREGLEQVSDTGALEPVIDQVIAAHPAQAAEYRAGKEKLMVFFVGQVMKSTGGKANPALLQEIIKRKLQS